MYTSLFTGFLFAIFLYFRNVFLIEPFLSKAAGTAYVSVYYYLLKYSCSDVVADAVTLCFALGDNNIAALAFGADV